MLRRVAGPGTARREGWRCNRSRGIPGGHPRLRFTSFGELLHARGQFPASGWGRRENDGKPYNTSGFRSFGRKHGIGRRRDGRRGAGISPILRSTDRVGTAHIYLTVAIPEFSRGGIGGQSARVLPGSLSQSTDSCGRGIFGFLSFRPPSPFRVPPRRSIRGTSMGTVGRID